MRTYTTIFQQTLAQYVAYRGQLIAGLLQGYLTPGLMLLALSRAQPLGTPINSLIPYYLVVAFVFPFVASNVDEEMDELAEKGDIYRFLVKPISLYRWLYTKHLSERMMPVLWTLPLILILLKLFSPLTFSWLHLPQVIIALAVSFTLSFNVSYFLGLFCFWLDEFWAIHNVKYVSFMFLSGSVLPYTFFPDWAARILSFTPFPYLASWVFQVVNGGGNISQYGIALLWIGITGWAVKKLESRAINHYSYTGG